MTIQTIKFSQMTAGGDLANDDTTPGLLSGANVLFNNPWTFLAPGPTSSRPTPSDAIDYRMRFNTTMNFYEYYDPVAMIWVEFSGSGVGTVNPGLVNDLAFYASSGQAVSPLATADNSVLVTNGIGLPSLSTTLPSGLAIPGAAITASTAALLSGSVVAAPVSGTDLVNKTYVDGLIVGTVASATGTVNQVLVNGTSGTAETGAIILTLPQDIATTSNPTFDNLKLTGSILGSNGDVVIGLLDVASPVNYLTISNDGTGFGPILYATGSDTNIDIGFDTKGTGLYSFDAVGNDGTQMFHVQSSAGTTYLGFLSNSLSPPATINFPNASGTIALTSSLPTPAALTASNDTNVTVTLGGTPSTALLEATSITMGWSGQLGLTRGGTAASLTASNGGIVYSTASALAILAGTATANLPLLSGSSTTPSWGSFALSLGGALTTAGAHTLSGAFASTFTFSNTTSVTFPTSGTLATTSELPTGAALTSSNDTNVTITLGGTPATALLQAASITLGWTGQLSLARGGSNASLTASNGGIVYSTASAMAILAGTATATQMLQSGASGAPAWSTTIWPATSTINQLLYSSAANTIAGLATANNGILITSAGGVPSIGNTVGAGLTMPSITFNSTSGIIGTTTNNNAAAGSVGEFQSNIVADSTVSLTTNTNADVTSLVLQPGDYDVFGNVAFNGAAGTGVIINLGWLSTTSATLPASNLYSSQFFSAGGTVLPYSIAPVSFVVPSLRVTVANATTTTVYLSVRSAFITSTSTAGGGIYARRRR